MTVYVESIDGVEFSLHTTKPAEIALQAFSQPNGSQIVLTGKLTPTSARKLAAELNAAASVIDGDVDPALHAGIP